MIRVFIADDHAIVREGLKQIVSETRDITVVGEAATGEQLVKQMADMQCDVVLLDIAMPGRGGIEILKRLKTDRPDLPVLILSMYPEEQYAIRALKAGASGYLTKESVPEELIKAVRKVRKKGKYISPSLAENLAEHLDADSAKPVHEQLSDREYQIMLMVVAGKTVREISSLLSLSDKTISTYRTRIFKKLNVKNNVELTHYAMKKGLVS